MMTSTLDNAIADREGWINSRAVVKQLNVAAEKGWAPNQFWYIFVLESWLRHEQDSAMEITSPVFEPEGAAVLG